MYSYIQANQDTSVKDQEDDGQVEDYQGTPSLHSFID